VIRASWPLDRSGVGEALLTLHEPLEPYPGELPGLDSVLEEVERLVARLDGSELLAAGEPGRLRSLLARSREALGRAGLPPRPLHVDAHAGNLLRTADRPVWTDLEDTFRGPVEWDLACLVSDGVPEFDEALSAYGRPRGDPVLAPFLEARRLQVAVWTAFMAERHPELRERARRRIGAVLGR
jgi:Ser/Thr protein kinase RdoA (MazF antagonist)